MSGYLFTSLTRISQIPKQKVSFRAGLVLIRMSSSHQADPGTSKLKVEHDTQNLEFYIKLNNGKDEDSKAVLQYSYITPDHVDLEHTVVPPQFRGHGVAKVLAQTAFDHFVDKGALIRPTCTYLQKFYNENPLPRYKEKVKWD